MATIKIVEIKRVFKPYVSLESGIGLWRTQVMYEYEGVHKYVGLPSLWAMVHIHGVKGKKAIEWLGKGSFSKEDVLKAIEFEEFSKKSDVQADIEFA